MLRLLHTSDWHLGHTLNGHHRDEEHRRFLAWLLDLLQERPVDVLLVTGDIFDQANPPVVALSLLYDFLARLHGRLPRLQTILIGGNHDSAMRLEAPAALLKSFGVRVVGALPPPSAWRERLWIPLVNGEGRVEGWCLAMPFLRLGELPGMEAAGLAEVYRQALQVLASDRQTDQSLVVTGHCTMAGAILSEWSERKILGGDLHALSAAMFGDSPTYVGLGHLHKAQQVAGCGHIRYSGSPIPLSMGEEGYRHQVLRVEMAGPRLLKVEPVLVPRTVQLLRIPDKGWLPLTEVLARLAALPRGLPQADTPFLEVGVWVTSSREEVRLRVEEALHDKAVRLVRLAVGYAGQEEAGCQPPAVSLVELTPEEVFRRRYHLTYLQDPPSAWLAAFHELMELASREEA